MIKILDLADDIIIERLLEVQQAAYRIEAALIGFDEIPPLFDIPQTLRNSGETFYGYFVDNVLAGAIACEQHGTTLDICRMMVHPDYFRRGIASALLRHVEATAAGVDLIVVSTGTENAPARQLYERHGFTAEREQPIAVGVTMTVYEKRLVC